MRIIITGGRHRDAYMAIVGEFAGLEDEGVITSSTPVTIVHGACPTGADHDADTYAGAFGCDVEPHPADWKRYGRAAGLKRNEEMAALGADLCLAFPSASGSPGTWDMIRRAAAHGIRVIINPERKP